MKERSDEMAIASTRMLAVFRQRINEYQQAIKPLVDMRMELHCMCVRMVLHPDGTMVREYPDDVTRLDANIVSTMELFRDFYFKSANAARDRRR
jgi:hypothetical protein